MFLFVQTSASVTKELTLIEYTVLQALWIPSVSLHNDPLLWGHSTTLSSFQETKK